MRITGTVFCNQSDVLPVTQPTVPKHWRKLTSVTTTNSLILSSVNLQSTRLLIEEARCSFYAGSPTLVLVHHITSKFLLQLQHV